jgi:hypothetical protein
MGRVYIRDDLGCAWYFDREEEKIKCQEANHYPDNGYPCQSLEDGVDLLNQYGYITDTPRAKLPPF